MPIWRASLRSISRDSRVRVARALFRLMMIACSVASTTVGPTGTVGMVTRKRVAILSKIGGGRLQRSERRTAPMLAPCQECF